MAALPQNLSEDNQAWDQNTDFTYYTFIDANIHDSQSVIFTKLEKRKAALAYELSQEKANPARRAKAQAFMNDAETILSNRRSRIIYNNMLLKEMQQRKSGDPQLGDGPICFYVPQSMGTDEFLANSSHLYGDKVVEFHTQQNEKNKNKNIPTIAGEGEELTGQGKLHPPVIGRETELGKVRRKLNNPDESVAIIGPSGTGKSALVEGLAFLIDQGQIKSLQNKRIFKISAADLVAGTQYRGTFEEKMKNIFREARENRDILIFIDEVHMINKAGETRAGGQIDLANMLKQSIGNPDIFKNIQIIVATTKDEWEKFILTDEALSRRFVTVEISEPEPNVCIEILKGTVPILEQYYKEIRNYEITFDVPDSWLDYLMKFIVDATVKHNRCPNDNKNNPALCLSILKEAFGAAVDNDQSAVRVENFVTAIKECEKLKLGVREAQSMRLFDEWIDALAKVTPNTTSNSSEENGMLLAQIFQSKAPLFNQ